MKTYERKLTESDIQKIEQNDGDLYCLFTQAQLIGYGVYSAQIIDKDGEKFLRYSMGDSCD